VPDEFWKPDAVAINASIRGGKRHIPGCEVYQKDSISIRLSEELESGT
jgi:hypothetical protein